MSTKTKYPRTPHLPWSLGRTSDDKVLSSVDHFIGKRVVVTEKMDGENTTLYCDGFHARSVDSRHHPSRDWLAAFHASIASSIPEGWRVCGENLYAKHSIEYVDLSSYFLGFSIWNDKNVCLDWDETLTWFELIGVTPVSILYEGSFSESLIKGLPIDLDEKEGYVVRSFEAFSYDNFSRNVGKFVRESHVQTDTHWMHSKVIPNILKV